MVEMHLLKMQENSIWEQQGPCKQLESSLNRFIYLNSFQ